MKNILLFFSCLLLACTTYAQITPESPAGGKEDENLKEPVNATYFLSVEKPGRIKRMRFYVGEPITVTFKGSKERQTCTITKIKKDTLELSNAVVPLDKIAKITLYKKGKWRDMASLYLPVAGLLYFVGDMVNPMFSGRDGFQVKPGSVIVPGVLIGTGLIIKAFSKRTLKMNKNRYLKILEKI